MNKLNISEGNIDEVILVGGSTKIPRIRRMLKSIFFREPNTFINPDEAVASGAAIMASKLSGIEEKEIKDITPYNLSIAVLVENLKNPEKLEDKNINNIDRKNLLISTVIKKGSPIPCENTKHFCTMHDNQEEIEFEMYEGDITLVKENNLLGKFRLKNLPKKKAGEVKFEVNFKIDSNGILTITVQMEDDKTKKESLVVETYKGGFSKNEFNLIEKLGTINTKDDKFFKMRDLRIEIDHYYQQIINPKKNIEDDEDEDEEEIQKRKEEEKFDLLNNYSYVIEEFISLFDKKDLENEAILEKIFEYLKKLFESYKMTLQIKSQINNDFINKIIDKIAEYFSKFYESKIFWLQDLLDIFIGTDKKFFYEIAINLMQLFMIKGQLYLSETKIDNFNKYYAKLYFKGALEIVRKYNLDKDINRIERKKKEQYEQMKNKCLAGIHNINAIFLIESEKSLSSNKLVDDNLKNEKETLYSLLDIFLENISKLEDLDDNNESYRIIALSYANIVKIEYKLLGNKKKLRIIRDYGDKCKEISEKIELFKHKSWFKEFLDIQRELEEEIRFKEEEKDNEKIKIKERIQDELNKIEKKSKEKSNVEFVKYIIDNYPPNGYKKEDDYVNRFNKNPEKVIEDLAKVYHTSNYHGKDVIYERYLIIEKIEIELNKIKINNK